MANMHWGRTMVEMIVRRSLHEIQQDPKRAIRKLVDLGMETSGGDLQKSFMGTAQRMLMNEDSPYYDLALDLVQRVDHERILKFGVNLGWNSLTEGAARIRELEAARGHNIPWSMTFHISEGPDALTEEEYRRLVSEGMELGIYSYFLMPEDDASVYKAVDLAGACRDCAFFLLVPGGCDWESGVSSLLSPANLMLGVDFGGSDWEMRVKQLQQQKGLYFLYRRYSTEEDVEGIVSGAWMQQAGSHAGLGVVLINTADPVSGDPGRPVYQYALDARMGQRYPALVLDFYPDDLYLDVQISHDPCFVGVLPDGTLTEYRHDCEMPTRLSVRSAPLGDLLPYWRKESVGL